MRNEILQTVKRPAKADCMLFCRAPIVSSIFFMTLQNKNHSTDHRLARYSKAGVAALLGCLLV